MSEFYTHSIKWGNKILVRGYKDGVQFRRQVPFSPTLFINSNKNTGYKSLNGRNIEPMTFETINEAKAFVDRYDGVEGFKIYGNNAWSYQYLSEKYTKEVPWDISHIRIHTLDIETTANKGFPDVNNPSDEVLLITVQDKITKKIVTFTSKQFIPKDKSIRVVQCADERDLLNQFIEFWNKSAPDVITGWYVKFFDLPYLINRITWVFGDPDYANRLSPWNKINLRSVTINGIDKTTFEIMGISVLDYQDLYMKYVKIPQENYKLATIAQYELGSTKLENPYPTFREFYEKDWQLFCEYNVRDVTLVSELEDKLKLIELQLTIAYMAKVNYEDIFGQVKVWETIIYNYLKKKNIYGEIARHSRQDMGFEGAYVKPPIVGKHKNVASFDLDSLYPHIIMQYNISPETLFEGFNYRDVASVDDFLEKKIDTSEAIYKDLTVTANGICYKKDVRGFLAELMDSMYKDRKKYKQEMLKLEQEYEKTKNPELEKKIASLNNLQLALKIALNSAYGALGNKGFRYFDIRMAEGITLSSQLSIRWIANKFNEYLNKMNNTTDVDYVIYIDTDSNYLNLNTVVENWAKTLSHEPTTEEKIQFMDKFCEKVLKPFIDKSYKELATYMNAREQKMSMKRESLCDSALFVAKKRYILNVHNSEGVQYATPKIKIVGLDIIKSSTPKVVRDKLREVVPIILSGTNIELRRFIKKYRDEFNQLPPEDIAFPRGVNEVNKYMNGKSGYTKGTPINSRAAILYNMLVDKYKLHSSRQKISNGDKIKFIHLKVPNTIREDVIGFLTDLPVEFGLHKYIDYETMFDKVFVNVVKSMTDSMGWSLHEESSLKAFF